MGNLYGRCALRDRHLFLTAFCIALAATPADPAGAQQRVLEEIVVTAQKREQSIQDVGITITAWSGEQMRELSFEDSFDIARMTPGVHISGNNGGQKTLFTIRGVTQNDFNDQTEAPVAVYVDEGYVGFGQGQVFGLFDLNRVEILKGPQGTLFGRNALDAFAATLETDDILGPSTIAATAVETLPKSRNVIPDRVRVVIDWRVLPGLSAVAAAARLEAFLLQHVRVSEPFGLTVRCGVEPQRTHTGLAQDRKLFTPGFLLDPSHPIARAAADTIASRTGRTPKLRPWTFATDGGHTCGVHGIPTIGYAPGEERFAHTNRERLDLRDARVAFDVYPDLINVIQAAL
jgi:hypothetical protein